MSFLISVIIPAYNVELFIKKAIISALEQEEVAEVVVVDDGSTDNTVAVIKELQKLDSKIKIFYHPNHINKGRSVTRNLAIKNASYSYIAFLDADDFYLADRFKKDKGILDGKPNLDGVYNAVGFHYYRDASESERAQNKICTFSKQVSSEELFDAVISSKYGYLHLNGLTVKKTVFDKIGCFNEDLLVAEDSDIIYKMALKCKLTGSSIDKLVAKRGIHENNIYTRSDLYKVYNIKLYESIVYWACDNNISLVNIDTVLKWLWFFKFKEKNGLIKDTLYWRLLFFKRYKLLLSLLSIKYFPVIRLRQELFPYLYSSKKIN